jgi:hypothetical protein
MPEDKTGDYDGPERRAEEKARTRWAAIGFGLLIACIVLAGLSIANSIRSGNQAEEAQELAEKTAELTKEVQMFAEAIQDSRYDFFFAECEDINDRNAATIDALNGLVEQEAEKHPERAARIERDVEGTILLIDAILPPTKDCAKKAAKAVELKSEE